VVEMLEQVGNASKRYGLVLAIGAGTSRASGLPDWRELVARLVEARFDGRDLFYRLEASGLDLSAIASCVRDGYDDDERFVETVRACLYRDFPVRDSDGPDRGDELVKHVIASNQTMRALAAMCARLHAVSERDMSAVRADRTFIANPLVRAIVTFNLDTVLREYVEARYGSPPLVRTIEGAASNRRVGRINMYYVHGNLRFDSKAGRPDKESSQLVLTENQYFDTFNNPTSIFTYSLLHLLREHIVVFVGLSMTDKNLRRLLYYSHSERLADLERKRAGSLAARRRRALRHLALLIEPGDDRVRDSVELALRALGVRTHWYSSHDQVGNALGRIYEASGQTWASVFD